MYYRITTHTPDGQGRTVEYRSKCEARRFFSGVANSQRYIAAEWEKYDEAIGQWSEVANMHMTGFPMPQPQLQPYPQMAEDADGRA